MTISYHKLGFRTGSSLEPRLYVPDFVSQLWRKIGGKAWKDLAHDTVAP